MFSQKTIKFTGPQQEDNVEKVDALFSTKRTLNSTEIELRKIGKKTVPETQFRKETIMPNLISHRRCEPVRSTSRLSFSNGPLVIATTTSRRKKEFLSDLLSPAKKIVPAVTITSSGKEIISESTLTNDDVPTSAVDEEDISPYNPYEVCSTFYPANPRLISAAYRGHELIKQAVKSTDLVLTPKPFLNVYGMVDLNTYCEVIAIYEHNQQYLLDINGTAEDYRYLENWFLHIVDIPVNKREWVNEQKFKLANGYSTICRIECRDLSQTFSASQFIMSLIPS